MARTSRPGAPRSEDRSPRRSFGSSARVGRAGRLTPTNAGRLARSVSETARSCSSACSACLRPRTSRSSLSRSEATARFWSSTSVQVPTQLRTWPSAPRRGSARSRIQRKVPSARFNPILHLVGSAGSGGLLPGMPHRGRVVRVNQAEPDPRVGLVRGQAEEVTSVAVQVVRGPVGSADPNDERQIVREERTSSAACRNCLLSPIRDASNDHSPAILASLHFVGRACKIAGPTFRLAESFVAAATRRDTRPRCRIAATRIPKDGRFWTRSPSPGGWPLRWLACRRKGSLLSLLLIDCEAGGGTQPTRNVSGGWPSAFEPAFASTMSWHCASRASLFSCSTRPRPKGFRRRSGCSGRSARRVHPGPRPARELPPCSMKWKEGGTLSRPPPKERWPRPDRGRSCGAERWRGGHEFSSSTTTRASRKSWPRPSPGKGGRGTPVATLSMHSNGSGWELQRRLHRCRTCRKEERDRTASPVHRPRSPPPSRADERFRREARGHHGGAGTRPGDVRSEADLESRTSTRLSRCSVIASRGSEGKAPVTRLKAGRFDFASAFH